MAYFPGPGVHVNADLLSLSLLSRPILPNDLLSVLISIWYSPGPGDLSIDVEGLLPSENLGRLPMELGML